jgi:phosphoribosylanthranilate isomerase
MTLVKICGITNLEDALVAVEAGVDALGFNFYNPSPRYVTPQYAREIIEQLPESILKVGVFVNETTPEIVRNIAEQAGLTALQLHGDESSEYCHELAATHEVIKVFAVARDFDIDVVYRYEVTAIMLDTKHNTLRGGTGSTFDWSIAHEVGKTISKLYLAGGLSPENVAGAVESVRPFAVDSCSALESEPGKKDHKRMQEFVRAVRNVSDVGSVKP